MLEDPRTKARSFLESTAIVSQLEDVLNHLVYEKPDDLHGYLANHFLNQCKEPKIATFTLRRLIGVAGEPAIHIDLTLALRNKTEQHHGLTINLSSGKVNPLAVKQLEALVNSTSLRTKLTRADLFDQAAIDELLGEFRQEHAAEMTKLAVAEAEAANADAASDSQLMKAPSSKRPAASPGVAKAAAPAAGKKGANKDAQPIEILADDPEPSSFAGHLLITGLSLTCQLITADMQHTSLYRLLCAPPLPHLSMPLPIIPILQSGPVYPGKQSIIKYFMIIPTAAMIHNEEWVHKLHSILQFLRDSLAIVKGSTLQSSYATDDGCLVFPMDKPEQGFDLLQNAVNNVCGTEEHWFDYAVQMGPYETFDYTRGKYEVITGVIKSPEELVDVYAEWLDTYPRCVMFIDPFRYADKPALTRLCDRISNRCYITSTDSRRYQPTNDNDDMTTVNCHLVSLDSAPTISELRQRMKILQETNGHALGFFERDHQEVAQAYLADFAVGFGCRFLRLPGLLSTGGQRTAAVLQRLSIIRDEIEMRDGNRFAWPKAHEFVHIRSSTDTSEPERVPSAANNKTKDKKKRA